MYREGAELITQKGLSPFSRAILGLFSGLFGAVMVLIAPPTDKQIFFYLFGGFCLTVCLACIFTGRLRQFIGSSIGVSVFFIAGWYLFSQIISGEFISGSRSQPSIINAVFFFILFGLPGISYAAKAKFGFAK